MNEMKKLMIRIGALGVALVIGVTGFSFCGVDSNKKLTPDEKQAEVCRQVVGMVANYNYKLVPIDDSLSRLVFKSYLKNIDPVKAYFLESYFQEFKMY